MASTSKRKRPESDLETIFGTIFSDVQASSNSDEFRSILRESKKKLESKSIKDLHKTATSYSFEGAVNDFNLKYKFEFGNVGLHFWTFEVLPDVLPMEPSHCLGKSHFS